MTIKLPSKNTDGFIRLKILFQLNKRGEYPTESEWHDAIGNKGIYPSHFSTWLSQVQKKGFITVENERYRLTYPLEKYIAELTCVEPEYHNIVRPREVRGFTPEMKGYAASIIKATGAHIRDISFCNGDTSPEKFRGI